VALVLASQIPLKVTQKQQQLMVGTEKGKHVLSSEVELTVITKKQSNGKIGTESEVDCIRVLR